MHTMVTKTIKIPLGHKNIHPTLPGLECTTYKIDDTCGGKTRRLHGTLWDGFPFPSLPWGTPFGPRLKNPWCHLMFRKKQLAGHISSCKWNYLFLWNMQDLKDIFPLLAHGTRGLPALTFDKKGRLQLPAACQHQTVTFQTTVNLTDL